MRRSGWSLVVWAGVLVACGAPSAPRHEAAPTTSGGDAAETRRSETTDEAERQLEMTGVTVEGEAVQDEYAAPSSPPEATVASEAPASQDYDDTMSLSVGTTTSTSSAGGLGATVDRPNLGMPIAREPSPLELMGYTLTPTVPTRVLLATLELPPGERFVPPASSCQDTLLYVASGTLDASGTGIASVDAPATLYAGDALRFGPEGDGLVVNNSSEPVRTLVALARSEDGGPARIAVEERGDRALCPDHGSSDALSQPQRVASFATSPPLVVMDGALEVRILLDADASGAEHAGLAVLTGSASFAVPEHVHDEAAEILYFESGRGTMHVGERDVEVAPGVSVYVPEGTPHSFEPSGSSEMRALQFYAPSGPEQRFRGMAGG